MEFSTQALFILGLAALCTGISKTGVPGLGIVFVVLVPMIMPAKLSTGYILPFLVFGDILAVVYWRRAVIWRMVLGILPAMFVGIALGYLLMDRIDDAIYGRVLGGVVLLLLALDELRRHFGIEIPMNSRVFAWSLGLLAGLLTMLANAAGSVVMLYLLAMNVSKEQFVGIGAWLYFIVNLFKVPFSISLGLITAESLKLNFMMLPLVLIGGWLGVKLMRRIPPGVFMVLMRVLAFLGGLKLLLF